MISPERKLASAYEHVEPQNMILRDHLAFDRTVLANERTVLAYARTAIALLLTGAILIRFGSDPNDWLSQQPATMIAAIASGGAMVLGAIATAIMGLLRYWKVGRRLTRVYRTEEA